MYIDRGRRVGDGSKLGRGGSSIVWKGESCPDVWGGSKGGARSKGNGGGGPLNLADSWAVSNSMGGGAPRNIEESKGIARDADWARSRGRAVDIYVVLPELT